MVVPVLLAMFEVVKDHYARFARALEMEAWSAVAPRHHVAVSGQAPVRQPTSFQ